MASNLEIQWRGRSGPFPLVLGPGVFSPTTTSRTLADAIQIRPGETVIDVGCGSGVLAFVAAKLGAAKVYGVDLSQRAVEAARENAKRLGLDHVCEFRQGDLLEPVRDVQANVLIGDVSGIPDAIAAESGWFDDVPAGGPDRGRAPVEVPAFDRGDPGARRASVPADGHDPERAGDPRRRARGLRRPHGIGDGARVPSAGSGREVEGGREDDEGRPGQLPSARQPVALAAPDLAVRPRLRFYSAGRSTATASTS